MNDRKNGLGGLIEEHTSLSPLTRPGQTLRNFFVSYPFLLSLVLGITIAGNPISKIFSSAGNAFRRAGGDIINENQADAQTAADSIYGVGGKATQPGDISGRQQLQPNGNGAR